MVTMTTAKQLALLAADTAVNSTLAFETGRGVYIMDPEPGLVLGDDEERCTFEDMLQIASTLWFDDCTSGGGDDFWSLVENVEKAWASGVLDE